MDGELAIRKSLGLDQKTGSDGTHENGVSPRRGVASVTGARRCRLPSGTPLSELPAAHEALGWLRRRGFDPKVIADGSPTTLT